MLQTVKLNNKEWPVSFGLATLRQFKTETKIDMLTSAAGEGLNLDLDKMTTLIYIALKNGARKEKIDFDYTVDEVADWFDSLADVLKVMELFGESMPQPGAEKK